MTLSEQQLTEGFEYLDDLRESGRTNMWGAGAYVEMELGYNSTEANDLTGLWMDTFDGESTVDERVQKALAEGT